MITHEVVTTLIEKKEKLVNNKRSSRSWAIGGATILGLGVGFIFLKTSVLIFLASILIGLGAGIVIASLIGSET